MTTDELYDLYNNSLYSILVPNMLSTLADRSSNIHGYNLVNRLLIYIQNKYATSLRSEQSWEAIGRHVKDKSYPINILENITKTTYKDPESGETVENTGLSQSELSKAIQIGAIERVKEVSGLKNIQVYNIKDTVITDVSLYKQFYKASVRKTKLSTLLSLASKKYIIACTKCNKESSFKKDSNTIEIGTDELQNKIDAVCSGIYAQLRLEETVADLQAGHDISNEDIEIMIDILRRFVQESIKSYCISDYEVESSSFYDIEQIDFDDEYKVECFMQLMYNVYNLVEDIIYEISPKATVFDECTLKKAAELLTILEANEALLRLKG